MRRDQLNRIIFSRFGLADFVEIALKRERKIDQRLLPRLGRRGAGEQFIEFVKRITKFFTRQYAQPLAQLRHSYNFTYGAEEWLMRQRSAKPSKQIQYVDDCAAAGSLAFNLKFVSVALSKTRQFVIRDSEHLAQNTDDFVPGIRIDHDSEQRG